MSNPGLIRQDMRSPSGRAPRKSSQACAVSSSVRLLVAVALAALGAGCVKPNAESVLPPRPAEFQIDMNDYRFDHAALAPAGRVVVRARNVDSKTHSMSLISLPEDYPPLDEQLHGEERRPAAIMARLPERPPGAADSFAVELQPGRYGLVCNVRDRDGVPHSLKGMNSEFRVGPVPARPPG